ncbi:ribosome biogenesis protein bop1 isoform X3 [Etheostoma spectabile]|uniref:ribosome biogenesis protein bop1 isoform X2 n=1 Tax=Etheostoma spectabile TaxID=54343 RepID=UPI0013AEB679|nr:ribosome biogenesis protein bop1-like isoform X2 [Etheostoma spectabile]XP_032364875.1 ribosome biogenesis protein bop1-like isoform X3 [Etheostoma spectabile]
MEESSSSGTRSGAQRPKMKEKEPEKSVKKRNKEEEEEEEEEIFDFTKKSQEEDEDEEDEDASDSEDSVFSGLEDSGSDEDEEEEELSDDEDEEEVDLRVEPRHTQQVETGTVKKTEKEEEEKKKEKTETDEVEGGATEEAKREDEYVHDSSDEEDIRNTVGNVPMEWYRDFPHIGYNLDGKKIYKPIRNKDELDDFLDKMENPDYWRTVPDKQTGSDVVLSDEQVQLVNRLQRGQFGDANFNEYEPQVEFFSRDVMLHPVTNRPADKRSFIPSLIEKEKVSKLVHAIKMGWIKPRRVEDDSRGRYYDLWANEDSSILARHKMHLPAPKIPLPGHQESYNPPPEYLFTDEERAMWEQQDPCDRKLPFVPRKFSSLRQVPAFSRFIHERFERCLDLYLCPRQRKMRVNVNPEDLIPKLPKPKDLQPFPTTQSLVYRGHSGLVRSISVSPSGQWLASGSDDGSVRFWEVCSSRCLRTVQVGGAVKSLAWNPNLSVCLLAVALDSVVLVLSPSLADRQVVLSSERLLSAPQEAEPNEGAGPVTWSETEGEELTQGIRLKIQHPKAVQQVTWHAKGDYLASVMPDHSSHMQVLIHQLSRRRSQNPFRKNKGLVQCVSFHPVRPYFFVGTQRSVRIYNLVKQEMTKKLQANSKWISSMAVHPGGDHVICVRVSR